MSEPIQTSDAALSICADDIRSTPTMTLTWGWLVRRSAIWAAALSAGVVAACVLYAVSGPSGRDAVAASASADPGYFLDTTVAR